MNKFNMTAIATAISIFFSTGVMAESMSKEALRGFLWKSGLDAS